MWTWFEQFRFINNLNVVIVGGAEWSDVVVDDSFFEDQSSCRGSAFVNESRISPGGGGLSRLNNAFVPNLLLTFVLDYCSCCRMIHIPGRRKPFRSRRRIPEGETKGERR